MSRTTFAFVALAVLAIAILCAPAKVPGQAPPAGEPTLRLSANDGRIGSAIHIGNGFAITAAHVVENLKTIQFQSSNEDAAADAEVLWTHDAYDVALIRLSHTPNITRAPVTCRDAVRGEAVKAYGNPLGLPFFETSGQVSIAIPTRIGPWRAGIVVSAPIAGGMSGGPVLDADSHLLGIIVGSVGAASPFGIVVPVKTICNLLGRT